MRKMILTGALIAVLTVPAVAESVKVTKAEYGNDWPFTVDEGRIGCKQGIAPYFSVHGIQYALTGFGQSLGMKPLYPTTALWRDDPAYPGTKVNLGPIMEKAKELCNKL